MKNKMLNSLKVKTVAIIALALSCQFVPSITPSAQAGGLMIIGGSVTIIGGLVCTCGGGCVSCMSQDLSATTFGTGLGCCGVLTTLIGGGIAGGGAALMAAGIPVIPSAVGIVMVVFGEEQKDEIAANLANRYKLESHKVKPLAELIHDKANDAYSETKDVKLEILDEEVLKALEGMNIPKEVQDRIRSEIASDIVA